MSIIIPANSAVGGGFNVDNSLRFNSGSSDYLHFTPSSDGNRRTMTLSVWIKGSSLANGSSGNILGQYNSSNENNAMLLVIEGSGKIMVWNYPTGAYTMDLRTNRLLRDLSAWYHIVVAVDTTQGTASNRVKIYVNGVQQTSFSNETYPSQNLELFMNQNKAQNIGTQRYGSTVGSPFNGYMAEFVFIDGTQYAASDFGEFDEDSGIWKPLDGLADSLTFGTNGYYLDFKDSSALGNDVSGNDNDFTPVNLTAIDQSTDTCTNNFATFNPLDVNAGTVTTFSNGNTTVMHNAGNNGSTTASRSTLAYSSGKFYWETKCIATGGDVRTGIISMSSTDYNTQTNPFTLNECYNYKQNGDKGSSGDTNVSYGATYTAGDIIGIAHDADNGTLAFYKNGVSQGNAFTGLSTSLFWGAFSSEYNQGKYDYNFGSPPYTISSGNADGNGYGNFEYAVPSGYYSLNTKNLAEYG